MRNRTAVAISAFGLAIALASPAQAQKKNSLSTRSSEGRGAATSDANIKSSTATNDKATVIPAPKSKGGKTSRGPYGSCLLQVDNRSGYWVNLYTDGNYRGQVSPYGDLAGWVGCGATVFYGRADFTDGSYKAWGPNSAYVSGPFRWSIY